MLTVAACAMGSTATPGAEQDPRAVEFNRRIQQYMRERAAAAGPLLPLEANVSPAEIRPAQEALAARIRQHRADAQHGDVLTPAIRAYVREQLAPALAGETGRDVRAVLNDDAPEPGAVPLQVNAPYPSGTPIPTTPAAVLQALPPLPRGLTYRIIGRDLILLDQPANLVVDFMRNALPARANTSPPA